MEVRFCANCNKEGANKRCGSCKFVYYCDQTCQQKDWNKHKAVCQQLKQEREDLETKTNQANQTIEPQMGIQFSTPSNTNKTETKTSQTTKNDDSETFAEPNLENMIAPLAKFMTSDSETEVMLDGCFGLLSVEICLHIFQFLDDPSLLASSQVCRAWYYLANDAQIWKTKIAEPSTARMYTTQLLVSNEEWKSLYYTLGRLDYQSSIFSFSILQEGVQASSTDHKKQSIAQTLDGVETTFWSSTGSPTTEFNEFLIYRLKQPICAVYEVSILPYQAAYQNGQPIYAPQRVQISIGFSPNHFHWKSPVFEMQNAHGMRNFASLMHCAETQTFAIAPYFAVGGYIRIELIGKCQTQPNVLEGVSARGLPLGTVSNTLLSWGMVNFALQHPQFLESLETIKDEMRSKYHVILDDYKVNRNPKDFFNGLSVITTKQMLPLLNAEQKKHQDLIHLYELIQGEQWKTAFTFIENNLQTLRSNEVLNLIQQYNTAYVRKYLSIMLKTPKLTKMESLKIVKIVLEEEGEVQRGLGFLLLWMADRKLTLSQELGDFVRKYDPMLAARIYLEVSVPDKVVDCYIQMKNYRRAVVLAMLFKSDIVKMLETLNQRNRVDALCFAVELGEAKGGSPIPLEKVASILQIEYGIDEWDLRKVIRKACEECLEAQPEENNNRPQGLYAHPVFGNNMDVVDNYEFVDEAEDDDLAEDEEEEDE